MLSPIQNIITWKTLCTIWVTSGSMNIDESRWILSVEKFVELVIMDMINYQNVTEAVLQWSAELICSFETEIMTNNDTKISMKVAL